MNDNRSPISFEALPSTTDSHEAEPKLAWQTPDFAEASVAVATHGAYNSSGSDGTFFS